MGKKRKELSQAEIWDDSALIESWDSALEEYKLYHSIHARGERVEDVLAAHLKDEAVKDSSTLINDNPSQPMDHGTTEQANGEPLEDGELDDGEGPQPDPSLLQDTAMASQRPEPCVISPGSEKTTAGTFRTELQAPECMIGTSTQDEALKNLMMSWYWAGYYTGLYEGRKQAGQLPNQDGKDGAQV